MAFQIPFASELLEDRAQRVEDWYVVSWSFQVLEDASRGAAKRQRQPLAFGHECRRPSGVRTRNVSVCFTTDPRSVSYALAQKTFYPLVDLNPAAGQQSKQSTRPTGRRWALHIYIRLIARHGNASNEELPGHIAPWYPMRRTPCPKHGTQGIDIAALSQSRLHPSAIGGYLCEELPRAHSAGVSGGDSGSVAWVVRVEVVPPVSSVRPKVDAH